MELKTRDSGQNGQRGLSLTLCVLEVAGGVVRDSNWKRSAFTRTGGGEKLAHISHPPAHGGGSVGPIRIILQQMSILFHDCAAAGSIDRDKGAARAFECRNVAARERAGSLQIAAGGVERTAAVLPARFDHRVTVYGENAFRRAI